jgi:hypothetical protein
MQPVIIADASCLILLEKIGELTLLQKLYGKILITQIIADEFGLSLPDWIVVQNPADASRQQILELPLTAVRQAPSPWPWSKKTAFSLWTICPDGNLPGN